MESNPKQETTNWIGNFKRDLPSSLVVFLVALPLCMGIAIASGVDPARGLLTGIIGGLIVSTISGCPLGVSGPAAGLTVLVYQVLQTHRTAFLADHPNAADEAIRYSLIALGVVVLLAGLIQIAAGVLRTGRWFRAVSPAVIYGMLAGIGVLIFSSQFHVMIDDKPHGEGLTNLLTIPQAIGKALVGDEMHRLAAATGIVTIVTIVLWGKFASKQMQIFPAPLVGVIAATIFSQSYATGVQMIDVPANLLEGLYFPTAEWLPFFSNQTIWIQAFTIAAVASAETLLCATAVDRLHNGQRTKYDRELVAQGVGNTVCGLLTALPMTAVIVRSSANVQAGARTRWSAFMHGAWLLLFVCSLPFLLSYIPRSALGAILVYTGYKLVNWQVVKSLWEHERSEAIIYGVTVFVIVAVDLLTGVITGVVLAAIKLLYTFSHLQAELDHGEDRTSKLRLTGSCTFIRLPVLAEALEAVPPGVELHVDIDGVSYIDHACLETLNSWAEQQRQSGGELVIDWDSVHHRSQAPRNGNGTYPKAPVSAQPQPETVAAGESHES